MIRGVGRSNSGKRVGREPLARMHSANRSRSSSGPGPQHANLAFAADLLQTAAECGDHFFLACPHGRHVHGGRWEGDAPLGQVFGFRHALGHVQQGFGGNAAAQQAHAAQSRLLVHQRDLDTVIGGQKGRRIAARSAAKYNELRVHGTKVGLEAIRE
jgi:hypothetical protein